MLHGHFLKEKSLCLDHVRKAMGTLQKLYVDICMQGYIRYFFYNVKWVQEKYLVLLHHHSGFMHI